MPLGRKPVNEFIEASLVFKENSEIKKFDVKMPSVYSITMEIIDPDFTKAETTWEYFVKDASKMDDLVKEIENQPVKVKVIKIVPAVGQLIDLCPRCHKRGVPKIEKKDTSDSRARSWRNREQTSPPKKRDPEFWLVYTHSKTKKKCRIRQYVNTPYPAYKQNKIDIENYFFPHILLNMKRDSIQYSD